MSLRFEIVDHGKPRADLTKRRETKFTFDARNLEPVRSVLSGNCRRLVHNEAVSTVRSIYFDDGWLSACAANINGLGMRKKFRLRWYDSLLPQHDLFLEVKWRNSRVTGKHRYHLRSNTLIGEHSYRQLRHALQHIVPEEVLPVFVQNTEPVVLVEYRREHYISPDQATRLTMDYDLRFYRQWGMSRISVDFPCALERLALVEGKTPVGREGELQALMYPLRMRPGRCSKYVHGCQQIGLVNV